MQFKLLYRRLADALAQIERLGNISEFLELALATLLDRFRDELGFEGGRIYGRDGEDFFLCCAFGSAHGVPLGIRVPRGYLPHLRTLDEGIVVMRHGEAGFDEAFEKKVGVGPMFAAIAVGEGNSHVIAFSVKDEALDEQILFSLTAVRHVINLKLQQMKFSGVLEESRVVQDTILPLAAPPFAGYELFGRSRPVEEVGVDIFDYVPVAEDVLGIAIADSSGHGLPSALLARDVVTGLRMGVEARQPLATLIERLNRVIHRSALASKFVSLFYGELSADGSFNYCNAGHNPPLLLRDRSFLQLQKGGMVLGPLLSSRYENMSMVLLAGDLLLLYTDGVVERGDPQGEMFGIQRLEAVLLEHRADGAAAVVAAVLQAVDDHGRGTPAADDMTVLAVRRLAAPAAGFRAGACGG